MKKSFPGERQGGFDVSIEVRDQLTEHMKPHFWLVQVRKANNLSTLSWVQRGDWGVSPQVLDTARVLFREQDADGSGALEEEELFQVILLLVNRLGIPSPPEFVEWMEQQVTSCMARYDTDHSGTLEEDELIRMLN